MRAAVTNTSNTMVMTRRCLTREDMMFFNCIATRVCCLRSINCITVLWMKSKDFLLVFTNCKNTKKKRANGFFLPKTAHNGSFRRLCWMPNADFSHAFLCIMKPRLLTVFPPRCLRLLPADSSRRLPPTAPKAPPPLHRIPIQVVFYIFLGCYILD